LNSKLARVRGPSISSVGLYRRLQLTNGLLQFAHQSQQSTMQSQNSVASFRVRNDNTRSSHSETGRDQLQTTTQKLLLLCFCRTTKCTAPPPPPWVSLARCAGSAADAAPPTSASSAQSTQACPSSRRRGPPPRRRHGVGQNDPRHNAPPLLQVNTAFTPRRPHALQVLTVSTGPQNCIMIHVILHTSTHVTSLRRSSSDRSIDAARARCCALTPATDMRLLSMTQTNGRTDGHPTVSLHAPAPRTMAVALITVLC